MSLMLEKVRLVRFFLYEKEEVGFGEITGAFGPNGSGKSSLLDAIQIAVFGGNGNLVSLNAQTDNNSGSRSIRGYCLGQFGAEPEQRVRDHTTSYITLIWRNTRTGEPISMGVCLGASFDRPSHEVHGRYVLPGVELMMSDHLEVVDGAEKSRDWANFQVQIKNRAAGSNQVFLTNKTWDHIKQCMLVLRGSKGMPSPEAVVRAFRFSLNMNFDKSVDRTIRDDVLEARPTDIAEFRRVTDSFREWSIRVSQVKARVEDGEAVEAEFARADEASRQAVTLDALANAIQLEIANDALDAAGKARHEAEENLLSLEQSCRTAERQFTHAEQETKRYAGMKESHAAHQKHATMQQDMENAGKTASERSKELSSSLVMAGRAYTQAADYQGLRDLSADLRVAANTLNNLSETLAAVDRDHFKKALRSSLHTGEEAINALFKVVQEISSEKAELEKDLRMAEDSAERVKEGRAQLDKDVQSLLQELRDNSLTPIPVCDVVRVNDPLWQPAIEAFLGRHLQALLVQPDQEMDAFRLYRSRKDIHGVKIAMSSRQNLQHSVQPDSVAALISGDDPVAVAYLRRQFGDLMCATSNEEALSGQRTLTQDGMLVSRGEIERLRIRPAHELHIGADRTHQTSAILSRITSLKNQLRELNQRQNSASRIRQILSTIPSVASADAFILPMMDEMRAAQSRFNDLTMQLAGLVDADYVRFIEQEREWAAKMEAIRLQLNDINKNVGSAQTTLSGCILAEENASSGALAAGEMADAAKQHPEYDFDFASSRWDRMLDQYGNNYTVMLDACIQEARLARRRMEDRAREGLRALGAYRERHKEQVPSGSPTDWRAERAWMLDILSRLRDVDLLRFEDELNRAAVASQETFRSDVAMRLAERFKWLDDTMDSLNAVLRSSPPYSNGERYQFIRNVRPHLRTLMAFIKDVASHGASGGLFGAPGELPEEFQRLLEDKIAPGATGERNPLDDYREFFEFDIEILREDPLTKETKRVGLLSKRLGPGSGGEYRAPLYIIAGAALASAYRLDPANKDGMRLMLLDEAFNKMDAGNVIATMLYLEQLGLQVFMAGTGENLGTLSAFLHKHYNILRDANNNTIRLTGHNYDDNARELFRSDLPIFHPELVEQELAAMRSWAS